MLRGGNRLGIYFFEKGSDIRSTNVVYDHAYSAFSQSDVEDYKWEDILEPGDIFYFSGVTPAASDSVCQSLKRALTGIDQIDTYKEGMLEITCQFPNVKSVTSVLRNMHTVEEGDWMGIYYVDGKFYQSPIHRVHSLEAVGAGDAYGAAFVRGLINGLDPQKIVDFAISASVLKLMIQHDFNVVTQEDVFKIMNSKNTNLSR